MAIEMPANDHPMSSDRWMVRAASGPEQASDSGPPKATRAPTSINLGIERRMSDGRMD